MGRRDIFLQVSLFFERLAANCPKPEPRACYKAEAARYARMARQPLRRAPRDHWRNRARTKPSRGPTRIRPKHSFARKIG